MENKKNFLMQDYDFGRLLGHGNFGKVYCARNMHSAQDVAIKVVDKEKVLKVGLVDQTKREISVMKLVKHPNVIEFYEVMASKSKIYIVMEYAKGGELFKKVAKGRLTEDETRKYFQQLISAVDICHKRCVYHRDLKLENLLLDENGDLKVSDFGLSALAESKHQDGLLHTSCGTPAYAAPEVICRKGYDGEKADVWSCGVILFVLMAGYLPFHDSNLMAMYRKIRKAQYKCPSWFPQEVCGLLSEILDPNPATRVSISKILENPWFRKGFNPRAVRSKANLEKITTPNVDAVFVPSESNGGGAASKREFAKAASLNAFHIISLSIGFDLSGLFVENDKKIDVQFTSMHDASAIISKLEEIAVQLRLKVKKKEGGLLKLERPEEDMEGPLSIDAEIFEFTPCFHLVEVKKANGDAFEYLKLVRQELKPALKDIVWAWKR